MAEKPILFNTEMVRAILDGRKTQTRRLCKGQSQNCTINPQTLGYEPPYKPGDILWVRETWQHWFNHRGWRYEYKADYRDDEPLRLCGMYIAWRPSIHMPKEAARIFLKVNDVRAERLQNITKDEIKSEGLDVLGKTANTSFRMWRELWESTMKKTEVPRYGWDANPWVWVIEFERTEKPKGWLK